MSATQPEGRWLTLRRLPYPLLLGVKLRGAPVWSTIWIPLT